MQSSTYMHTRAQKTKVGSILLHKAALVPYVGTSILKMFGANRSIFTGPFRRALFKEYAEMKNAFVNFIYKSKKFSSTTNNVNLTYANNYQLSLLFLTTAFIINRIL